MNQIVTKIINVLTAVMLRLAMVGLAGAVALAFIQTVMRYVFGAGIEWAEEMIRMLVLFGSFLLAGPTMMRSGDAALTIVVDNIKSEKVKNILDILNTIVLGIASFFLLLWSYDLFLSVEGQTTFSQAFPKQMQYAIVPLGMAFLCIFCILKLLQKFTAKKPSETPAAQ